MLAAVLAGGTAAAAPPLNPGGGNGGGLGDRLPQGPLIEQPDRERPELRREPRISPAQAAAEARREHGGKVLDVHLERGARPHYRVKLLKDGNVRSVRVPAD
ncbi:hypothetical protein PC39_11102 [Salinisphaera sp. PC39]|uniref:PepSY domain-containing protein n=1 Tax=Salinisphaera sp. PC39 TaxID=1304156 RepID=UPI00333F4B42